MEIISTTRRHPEFERFVEMKEVVVEGEPDAQTIWLKIGVQSFRINDYCEDQHHAEWMRDMLCNALANMVKVIEANGKCTGCEMKLPLDDSGYHNGQNTRTLCLAPLLTA